MSWLWYGLAVSLAYPSGEQRGVISSFKLFLPAFATLKDGGGGAAQHSVGEAYSWPFSVVAGSPTKSESGDTPRRSFRSLMKSYVSRSPTVPTAPLTGTTTTFVFFVFAPRFSRQFRHFLYQYHFQMRKPCHVACVSQKAIHLRD